MPQIVYLQTYTDCNGHCRYCPFDEVYAGQEPHSMSVGVYGQVLRWLKKKKYTGRMGFLLHCEPTLDPDIKDRLHYARMMLPGVHMEVATNGLIKHPVLDDFDRVDRTPAGSLAVATSRAGNCLDVSELESRPRLSNPPCQVPLDTFPIAANGDVLLCCQDWRHEAVVGTWEDLDAARENQLKFWKLARNTDLEICRDCMEGKTAEEIGERLGKRFISSSGG